jgi:hypothetical protein
MVTRRLPLATPPEVAEYLQKPVATLAQWRYLGKGPRYSRIGRDIRYSWDDVDTWQHEQYADQSAAV